jgi:NAD(P)-dependent dehydrogenase (short-subunit alcohol dehydrogenase family)
VGTWFERVRLRAAVSYCTNPPNQPNCSKQSNVDDTVRQLRGEGLEVQGCACHVGSDEQRRAFVAAAIKVGAGACSWRAYDDAARPNQCCPRSSCSQALPSTSHRQTDQHNFCTKPWIHPPNSPRTKPKAYGPSIDVLVSNAAVNPAAGPLLSAPLDSVDKILDINVKAALALVQVGGGGSWV